MTYGFVKGLAQEKYRQDSGRQGGHQVTSPPSSSQLGPTDLEVVDHGLAASHIFAIVVIYNVEAAAGVGAGLGRVAPGNGRALAHQLRVLAEGCLLSDLALIDYTGGKEVEYQLLRAMQPPSASLRSNAINCLPLARSVTLCLMHRAGLADL